VSWPRGPLYLPGSGVATIDLFDKKQIQSLAMLEQEEKYNSKYSRKRGDVYFTYSMVILQARLRTYPVIPLLIWYHDTILKI
jgi:hypothetical protein